jgi:dienelactone hydrolase
MRILIAGMLLLEFAVLPSAQAAPKMESARFPSAQGVEITGYYFRPKGDGPFPAVIGMHGCGGLFERDRKTMSLNRIDWAQRFVDAGYVVMFPDSYLPRGFLTVCEIKPAEQTVKLLHQLGDLVGAATWLLSQPFVDKDKIALIGWGTGGTAVLRALDPQLPIRRLIDFKEAIAFYPRCDFLEQGTIYSPRPAPTILMGAADEWVQPAPCKALATKWNSPIVLYPGAYHNFDVPNVPVRKRQTGEGPKRAGTDPAARAKAIKETMALLGKAFAASASAGKGN